MAVKKLYVKKTFVNKEEKSALFYVFCSASGFTVLKLRIRGRTSSNYDKRTMIYYNVGKWCTSLIKDDYHYFMPCETC